MKMKRYNILAKAACGLCVAALLSACGSGTPKSPAEANLATTSDSISYFLGQMMAGNMMQLKGQDTTLNNAENADAFWSGYQEGLKLLRNSTSDKDKAYNAGLVEGVRLAQQIQQQQEVTPEFKFNAKLFNEGYKYSYCGDSVRGVNEAARDLNFAMEALSNRAEAASKKNMTAAMETYAKKNGYKKAASGFYVKVIKQGSGNAIVQGDSIMVSTHPVESTGRDLAQYGLVPTPVVLGKTLPMSYPFAKALLGVKGGSEISILMTPENIFGGSARGLGIKNDSFIIQGVTLEYLGKGK